ncbi:MAG: ribosome small subunit-dependent GTPase A [Aquificae bacterium]|nr:ribosome small subunit-dependent GTPase A [Aquificota bacterium]
MHKGLVVDREAQMIGVYLPDTGKTYRGIPRGNIKKKTKIYAGDYVYGFLEDEKNFVIEQIEDRKNILIRPPISNVDTVIIVETFKQPDFDSFFLDNLLVVYERVQVEPIIVFNKVDLLSQQELKKLEEWTKIYAKVGYQVIWVSAKSGEGIQKLKDFVKGQICILAGLSGVGKSSILSKLTGTKLEIGEISKKLKRGKHTTTGVKLIPFGKNSFVGDAPGFSKVNALEFVKKDQIKNYFREFLNYRCKYPNCSHTKEPYCAVKLAVEKGEISCHRYKNYLKITKSFVEDLKHICPEGKK